MISIRRPFFVFLLILLVLAVFLQAPSHLSYGKETLIQGSVPDKVASFMVKKQAEKFGFIEKNFEESVVPGEVIVKLKSSGLGRGFFVSSRDSKVKVQKIAEKYSLKQKSQINLLGQVVFQSKFKKRSEILKLISELNRDPDVEYAEPNYKIYASGEKVPWGISEIKAPQAWVQNGVSGQGVVVAVVDTGVDYNHPDLDENIWVNSGEIPGNGIDDDGNGFTDDYYGWDFAGWNFEFKPDNDPMDEIGHGTHVAGIIAAEENGRFVVGVAPKAKIMAIKVFAAAGYATARTVSDGILYAAKNGARIINLSLGSYYYSRAMEEAIKFATSRGVLVVAAAGNDWWDLPSYPAAYEDVISVGSTDEEGKRSWFSNFGKIDLVAPGSYVESLEMDGRTVVYSGTSMAAPHVCGVAALVLEKIPSLDAKQVRQVLESTALDLGKPGKDFYYGSGLVNALAASSGSYNPSMIILNSERGYLFADGVDEKEIRIRVYDENLSPAQGARIDLQVLNANPSSNPVYTDSSGEATVSVKTSESKFIASVRADVGTLVEASLDLMIKRTDVSLQNVWVSTENDESGYSKLKPYFEPGQKIFIMFDVFNNYYEPVEATVSYEVKDMHGNIVPGLSGSFTKTVVGENYGWFPFIDLYMPCGQDWLYTGWMVLPEGLEPGLYTVEASVTANGKVSSFYSRFSVLEPAPVLVYGASDNRYYDRGSGFEIYSTITYGGYFLDALNYSGYAYTYWDRDLEGAIELERPPIVEPFPDNLESLNIDAKDDEKAVAEDWPLLVVFDPELSWLALQGNLNTYLIKGGKVLISTERPFTYSSNYYYEEPFFSSSKQKPSLPEKNPFGAVFEETIDLPKKVTGETGSSYEGYELDVDVENWEGEGAANQIVVDTFSVPEATFTSVLNSPQYGEVVLDARAYPIFRHDNGKLAGCAVETSEAYRGVLLSFGLEAINNASARRQLVRLFMDWFFEAPEIEEVQLIDMDTHDFVSKISTSGRYILRIIGKNFSPLGDLKVWLGDYELSEFIERRTRSEIEITIDGSLFTPGVYPLIVRNPDGKEADSQTEIVVEAGAMRIFGENRILTAVELSRAHFSESPNVVIATAYGFADSLSAAPLAFFLNCPILLTHPDRLPDEVLEELKRLNVSSSVIVGGIGAVSMNVEEALQENNISVERIGGKDRYDTSALIAERLSQNLYLGTVPKVYVATGENFADAISASSLAASEYAPIILVKRNSIPGPIMNFIQNYGVQEYVIVGGTGAVSNSVESSLPGDKVRIAGSNRYETSARVAQYAIEELGFNPKIIYVSTGESYPDALTSGVCAALNRNPLLLVKPYMPLSQSTEEFLVSCAPVNLVKVAGGEGAVSQEVVERILQLIR